MNPAGKFPTKSERIERLERELRIAKAELNSHHDAKHKIKKLMNLQILAAEIVRRVQCSPDSAHNLAETVANLIRAEMEHDRQIIRDSEALDRQDDLEAALRLEFGRDFRPK